MNRAEYIHHVRGYAHIAREIKREDPAITDERLASELVEYLMAPDSFLHTWDGPDADQVRALEVLQYTAHRAQAIEAAEGNDAGIDFAFMATWAAVRDALAELEGSHEGHPKGTRPSWGPEPRVDESDRESLIRWLTWNDGNGCYTDDEALEEVGRILTLDDARALYREAKGI